MKIYNVILTGGVGSRLWPLSRKENPKQYLSLFKDNSLFGLTIERNKLIVDNFIIVGNKDNNHLSKRIMDKYQLEYKNIVEATPRNTAAAIAFAAFAVEPEDILLITPSDHIIEDMNLYRKSIEKAFKLASEDYIVTFGIYPKYPETGFGYIEYKEDDVLSFREKPNKETAKVFVENGGFLWNSGMFCFKAGVFLEELKRYEPEVYKTAYIVWQKNSNGCLDEEMSNKIPSISIDYAVMERSKKIKVVSSSFQWSDLGSFESLYDYLKEQGQEVDENGNMIIGKCQKYVSFIGLQNTILAYSEDALLILQKEQSQDVKKVYNIIEQQNPELL